MNSNRFFKTCIFKMLDSIKALAMSFVLVSGAMAVPLEGYSGTDVMNVNESVTYTVTVTSSNSDYGVVSGGDTDIIYEEVIMVSATAKAGYVFVSWVDENGTVVSTNKDYTFSVTGDVALTANFKPDDMFFVNLVVNPPGTGTIRGDRGYFWEGVHVAYTAAAHKGYNFESWTIDGVVVSDYPAYEFFVSEDVTLVANFKPEIYTISVSANPTEGGTVTGDGTYPFSENVTVTATINAGWKFVGWTAEGAAVSNDASYTFPVAGNTALVANFAVKTYTVTVTANNPDYGSVTSGETDIVHGRQITVTATANADCEFVNWTDANGKIVSTAEVYTFDVTENVALTANFKPKDRYFVTIGVNPAESGTVIGGGYYTEDTNVTLTATASTGYDFVNWTKDGEIIGTATTYRFVITEDVVLTANFALKTYDITVLADPSTAGTVTGAGNYTHGGNVTLTATVEEEGYNFAGWFINGSEVSTQPKYSFTATADITVTAKFALKTYPVTFAVIGGDNDALSASLNDAPIPSRTLVKHGSDLLFTANPPAGYRVKKWSLNSVLVKGNTTSTYRHDRLSTPILVRVEFEALPVITVDGLPADLAGSDYCVTASCGARSITVAATIDDPTTTVEINGQTEGTVVIPLFGSGEKIIWIRIIEANGEMQTYTLTVTQPIPFEQLVIVRWNNTMSVINNPANNGGYKFTSYRWFRDGEEFWTGQWYSEDVKGKTPGVAHEYQVEATTVDGEVLSTCPSTITLKSMGVTAHPNPVNNGQTLYIEADIHDDLLKSAVIEVYDVMGNRLDYLRAHGRLTTMNVNYAAGLYIFVLKGADGFTKEMRIEVK